MNVTKLAGLTALFAAVATSVPLAQAQTVKIGFISTYS